MISDPQHRKLSDWLEAVPLEEILADNDLEPIDALVHLFDCGLIELPHWLEENFYDEE